MNRDRSERRPVGASNVFYPAQWGRPPADASREREWVRMNIEIDEGGRRENGSLPDDNRETR